jgi:hypothetical protein
VLEIRVLGGLEVIHDGVPVTLPPSRKTRAYRGTKAVDFRSIPGTAGASAGS